MIKENKYIYICQYLYQSHNINTESKIIGIYTNLDEAFTKIINYCVDNIFIEHYNPINRYHIHNRINLPLIDFSRIVVYLFLR